VFRTAIVRVIESPGTMSPSVISAVAPRSVVSATGAGAGDGEGDGLAVGAGVGVGRGLVGGGADGAGVESAGAGAGALAVGEGVDGSGAAAAGADAVGVGGVGAEIAAAGSADAGVPVGRAVWEAVTEGGGKTGGGAFTTAAAVGPAGPGTIARSPSIPPAFPRSAVTVRATVMRPASAMPVNSPPCGETDSSPRRFPDM
jgi:hypothetical protein